MENLYEEMMEMRDHLLTRIEMLEDDVERLTEDNYEYAKELYSMEKSIDDRINSLSEELRLQFEGQESSKDHHQTSKRTS